MTLKLFWDPQGTLQEEVDLEMQNCERRGLGESCVPRMARWVKDGERVLRAGDAAWLVRSAYLKHSLSTPDITHTATQSQVEAGGSQV